MAVRSDLAHKALESTDSEDPGEFRYFTLKSVSTVSALIVPIVARELKTDE